MKEMAEKYINMLTPGHIKQFARSENVYITEKEVNIVYDAIKSNYNSILNNDLRSIYELKDKLSVPVYNKIIELVNKYSYLLH